MMKMLKPNVTLSVLSILFVLGALAGSYNAQCTATATTLIMYTAVNERPTDVSPGPTYKLFVRGQTPTNFDIVQEDFMLRTGLQPPAIGDTTSNVFTMIFKANMGRPITHMRLKNRCTGAIQTFKLDSKVTLTN
jgi:hypothetical protein